MNLNTLFRLKSQKSKYHSIRRVRHTIKFGSIFSPDSLRGVNLFLRSSPDYNSFLVGKPNKKILVKQSYVFLIWVNYLRSQKSTTNTRGGSTGNPSFFIYPKKNYKTTIVKAPMAHKTYSQEQFMVRLYSFSVTFDSDHIEQVGKTLNSVNKSLYFASMIKKTTPFVGTNMLFISKYNLTFYSNDTSFFSLVNFHKLGY